MPAEVSSHWVLVFRRRVRVAGLLATETVRLVRTRGLGVAARFVVNTARGFLLRGVGGPNPKKTNALDERFGTDTADNVYLSGLDIRSANFQYAVYYRPTDVPVLDELFAQLHVDHPSCSFVDYGSGKGLVLLRAASYPFRRVIGVEFARELYETARDNIERYPAELRRAEIELVHGDAFEYVPPAGNLVLYLYEPFEAPLMRRMVEQVRGFCSGRQVVVACAWSMKASFSCKPLWDAADFLAKAEEGEGWTIYRGGPR